MLPRSVRLPPKWLENHGGEDMKRMEFHPNSRLLKINACPNEVYCGLYDYVMVEGKGLKLARKELLPGDGRPWRQATLANEYCARVAAPSGPHRFEKPQRRFHGNHHNQRWH
jgi:hypothetical protein